MILIIVAILVNLSLCKYRVALIGDCIFENNLFFDQAFPKSAFDIDNFGLAATTVINSASSALPYR